MRWVRPDGSTVCSRPLAVAAAAAVAILVPCAVLPLALGQATQPAAASPGDLGSPKAAVKAFVTAQIDGDGKAIRDTLLATNPTEERMAGAIADLAVAIADLNRAMTAKFGASPTQQLMGDPADALRANMDKLDKATEQVNGDTATVVSPPDPAAVPTSAPAGASPQDSMMLRKVDGQWKVSVSDLAKGSNDENVQRTLASVDTAVAGYRSVLADVNAGKLTSVDAVAAELNAKMSANGATPPPAAPAR
jgi:hypothetical protein